MALPRKFKHLLELKLKDVETPDYVWITYAVCAMEKDSCRWAGWMIECALKKSKRKKYPTSTGDKLLPAMMDQVCPRCGKTLWRTAASVRMVPSEDQERALVEGRDYTCLPIRYED
jgi:predicted RNA-binding Zn-ribbon protein involved in translation (DUF1610 family)